MLLHTISDDQLFNFSFVPILFPIIHHYLCQYQNYFELI
jgi:hypothetical protein